MRLAPVLLVLLSLGLASCGGGSGDDQALSDLTSVDELRTEFNENRGEPRLLLLLSPT